ncbi:hypothetical protein MAR_023451, partial [Mya arenaria]
MGLKRISESSVLFIIGATLVFVSFVLGIVGIATPVWTQSSTIKNGTSVEYHSGLWRVCSTIDRYHSMEETFCLSRIEASVEGWMQGVQTLEIVGLIFFVVGFVMTLALLLWSSNARLASANPWVLLVAEVNAGVPSVHNGTPGWFQAIQTLEIVSLIFFVVGFVMTSALLLWSSNARLARANPWILLIAGIFMEVGVIIFVVKLGMNNLGYSLYLTWIASNCVIVASIIIYCAEQRNRRPTEFTSGPTTSTPVFYPPPSNTNPVHISQPTYTPQPVAPVQPQPVQRSKPPYPGAFQ